MVLNGEVKGGSDPSAALVGSLLGTAVGDALGLPYEGLSRRRAARIFGRADRHRLLFGYGLVSDDTEQSCMVAQALIASGGEGRRFGRSLAWRLQFWLLALPAGVGLATGRAILKLWIGFPPHRSGVFSAGNGPAMRSAILGVAVEDRAELRSLVRISTRITHTDPKAEYGAFAVALAAQMAWQKGGAVAAEEYRNQLALQLGTEGEELNRLVAAVVDSVQRGQSTADFAGEGLHLPQAVGGYVYQTVPVALHAWLSFPTDYRRAVQAVIGCGGDTDTTAAIVGGIVGAAVGKAGIPAAWLADLREWPRSVAWMERLGERLAQAQAGQTSQPLPLAVAAIPLRNLLFLGIVLLHGLRRLLPPY